MPIVDTLCPHRGGKTKMTTGTGKTKVLAAGELFVEYPDTGVGSGKSKIKIGDGVTAYSSLPYALGETSTDLITFSESTATSVTQALNEAVSGASLATIIGGLKKAIQLASQSGGVNIFTGTLEEWNQLTDAEKAEYDLISNDEPGGLQDMFPSSLVGYGANSNVEAELNKLNDDLTTLDNSKLSIDKKSIHQNTSVNLSLEFEKTYLLVLTAGYGGFAIVALLTTNYENNSVKIDKIIDNNGGGNLAVTSVDITHVTVTVGGLGYDAKLGIMPVA